LINYIASMIASNPVAIYSFFFFPLPISSNIAFNFHSIRGGCGEGGAVSAMLVRVRFCGTRVNSYSSASF
jgi:hypothetical protein